MRRCIDPGFCCLLKSRAANNFVPSRNSSLPLCARFGVSVSAVEILFFRREGWARRRGQEAREISTRKSVGWKEEEMREIAEAGTRGEDKKGMGNGMLMVLCAGEILRGIFVMSRRVSERNGTGAWCRCDGDEAIGRQSQFREEAEALHV
ncbi:hypothetical protein R1flu_011737 [Riccia fluitans]|uniref:Uncharacterized protein n=1 Tax=Riccia fluitans TaxID=41844 RepID=A0ABD1Z9J7_9MARC